MPDQTGPFVSREVLHFPKSLCWKLLRAEGIKTSVYANLPTVTRKTHPEQF